MKTLVDQIVDAIASEIFQGRHAPGTHLPTIRALAKTHDTTIPTIQRVVAKLDELGLVAVRQGSGIRVLDPRLHANQAAFPYWLEALRSQPMAARELLSDFLELRAILALELLVRVKPMVSTGEFEPVRAAVAEFAALAANAAALDTTIEADLAIVRALLALAPQTAFATVFNTLEGLLRTMPEVASAMYADPAANAAGWAYLLEVLHDDDFATQLRPLLRAIDQDTLSRFVTALEESP